MASFEELAAAIQKINQGANALQATTEQAIHAISAARAMLKGQQAQLHALIDESHDDDKFSVKSLFVSVRFNPAHEATEGSGGVHEESPTAPPFVPEGRIMLAHLAEVVSHVLSEHGDMPVIVRVAGNESYSAVDFDVDYVRVELDSLPGDTVSRITPRLVIACGE